VTKNHGLLKGASMAELIQRQEDPNKKLTKAELAKKIPSIKERDNELVTGIFRYIEKPRQTLRFRFHKYDDDGNKQYELEDGKRYRIPRMVARHLNNNCYYVEYKRLGGAFQKLTADVMAAGTGNESTYAQMYGVDKQHRTEFRSLEFMDDDISLKPEITEVRYL
jgi:hypothetical protein